MARPIVQIIDILRDDQNGAWPFCRQSGQGVMRGIGANRFQLRPSLVVEFMHKRRIGGKTFGCGNIFDAMSAPQPIRSTKRSQT